MNVSFFASVFGGEIQVKLLEMRTQKQQRENKLLMIEKTSLGYSDSVLLQKQKKKRRLHNKVMKEKSMQHILMFLWVFFCFF